MSSPLFHLQRLCSKALTYPRSRHAELLATSANKSTNITWVHPHRRCLATKRQQRAAAATGTPLDTTPKNLVLPSSRFLISPTFDSSTNSTLLSSTDSSSSSSSNNNTNDLASSNLFSLQQATELYNPAVHLPSAPQSWEGYEVSTPLTQELLAWIGVSGRPISVAEFMRLALTHPEHGYYTLATTTTTNQNSRDDFFDEDDDEDANTNEDDNDDTIIGPGGDFVTAPEISQIFGECLGVWYYTQWQQLFSSSTLVNENTNKHWQWLECGPGRGSLTQDFLQFASRLSDPSFAKGCRAVHLIEASPVLREMQKEALQKVENMSFVFAKDDDKKDGVASTTNDATTTTTTDDDDDAVQVHWHESLAAFRYWQQDKDSAKLPTFAVCQEFLDALPIYAFEKTPEGPWRERLIDVALSEEMMDDDEEQDDKNDNNDERFTAPTNDVDSSNNHATAKPRLRIVLAPEATPALKTLLRTNNEGNILDETSPLHHAPTGSVVEVSPESILVARDLAAIFQQYGGAGLIVDYGQEGSADTIRGFAQHEQVHFLSRPGQVDVTADVDFAALRHAVNNEQQQDKGEDTHSSSTKKPPARAFGPVGQGEFLIAMGMQERVIQLMERPDVTDEQAEDLYGAMVRLASPEEMGERYKVLSIVVPEDDETSSAPPPGFV